jgi:hypothetical protein
MKFSLVQEKIITSLKDGGSVVFRSSLSRKGGYLLVNGAPPEEVPRLEMRVLIARGYIAPGPINKHEDGTYQFEYKLYPPRRTRHSSGARWSDKEIEIVRGCYKVLSKETLQQLLPGRTWHAIEIRANIEGVGQPKWTQQERTILHECYEHLPRGNLQRLLPARTWASIKQRAQQEGVGRRNG